MWEGYEHSMRGFEKETPCRRVPIVAGEPDEAKHRNGSEAYCFCWREVRST